jgi:carboxymethylenebutenolidase
MARARELDQKQSLRDFDVALNWLQQRPYAAGVAGTVGFCMGGTLVLDIAAERNDVVTVCFYGFPRPSMTGPKGPPAPLDEVDRISGPILGFWGDQDQGVGMDNVKALDGALSERGVEHEFRMFPGLGHGFMAASRLDPEAAEYDAACQAWTAAVDFFRRHIE